MRALTFSAAPLTADIEVKQTAATKQMNELVQRLDVTPKYHTLTKDDRAQLKQEGYAPDLINNLVVMTLRQGNVDVANDKVLIGYTYAAFDPALYDTVSTRSHLAGASMGCCCYCESFLLPTDSGIISHYRPVQLLDEKADQKTIEKKEGKDKQQPSPYFGLAYQQDNWVYSCRACGEKHKAGLFPVAGARYPKASIEQEKPLLVNPYQEDPRHFIRFNPKNAVAYAYDDVCDFYRETHQLSAQAVETLLWQQPSGIPDQWSADGHLLTNQKVQTLYQEWRSKKVESNTRGQASIATLGLNRTALVLSRLAFLKQFSSESRDAASNITSMDDVDTYAYRSLAFDALRTLNAESQGLEKSQGLEEMLSSTSAYPNSLPQKAPSEQPMSWASFPVWFRSCLSYFVEESELAVQNKRRLVLLSSKDSLYGQKLKEKCVFLPIDWQQDATNIIKVRSHRNIWESSFSELADSRPQELLELFANNEVWVEGDYAPLSA